MGRERQKKKNRSSIRKVKATPRGRTKEGKKKVNFVGNSVIAKNWDRKLTMVQNYNNLGLSSRLNALTGGSEKKPGYNGEIEEALRNAPNSLSLPRNRKTTVLQPTETRVERDPATGRIIRIIRDDSDETSVAARKRQRFDQLNDLLDDSSGEEVDQPAATNQTAVVAELEAQAEEEAAALARRKRPRQQSKREEEWVEKLVDKYRDDYAAMTRDRKLNPMQQSEGDIRHRVRKWKERMEKG